MIQSALDHYTAQQRITAAALIAAERRAPSDTTAVAQIVALFQAHAAAEALASVDKMLAEQQIEAPPSGVLTAAAFAGTASDGMPLPSLLDQAKNAAALALMVVTQVQDAARSAASTSIAARENVGWVRMISPGACSRCVVQAGKFFKFNDGFLRHPRCACRHIPATENIPGDPLTDPEAYFTSLSPREQDQAFTKAGAEAIRQGADISQVVNARRVTAGMSFAGLPAVRQQHGNLYTTEGTTRRALAYKQQAALRRNGSPQQRLMPETILAVAKDRADAQRLLRLYGYILDRPSAAA